MPAFALTARPRNFCAVLMMLGAGAAFALCLHATSARAQSDRPDPDGAGVGSVPTGSYHYTPPPANSGALQNPAAATPQDPNTATSQNSWHATPPAAKDYSAKDYYAAPAAQAGTQDYGGYNAPAMSGKDAPVLPKKADVPFRTDSGLITAEYYLAVGKYAQALSVLKGVMERHPDNADAYTYRGYAYEKLGDVKRAEEDYRRALLIDPRHLGANRYIASLYLRQGDLQRALEQMQVIRMVCGAFDCAEQDELEAEINRYKQGQKDAPADNTAAPARVAPSFRYNH